MPPLSPRNETTTTNDPTATDKPETDDAEKKPPSENETTSHNPEANDAEEKPPPENETTSHNPETNAAEKKPPPANETTSQNPEANDAEKKPPPENETTSTMIEPEKTTTTPPDKPEADDAEKKLPSEIETTSTMIEPDKTTNTPTNDRPEISEADDNPPAQEISPSGNNSTTQSQATAAHEPEINEDKTLEKNADAADPEISPANNKNDDPKPAEVVPRPTKKASSLLKKVEKYLKLFLPKSPVAKQGPKAENAGETEKDRLLKLIREDLNYIKDGADKLLKFHRDLEKVYERADEEYQDNNKEENVEYLKDFRNGTVKLKLQVPSKFTDDESLKLLVSKAKDQKDAEGLDKKMPWLSKKKVFKDSLEFKDFQAHYEELPREVKLCLLCFSIFPENSLIKKRLMVQWWVVEGYASDSDIAGDYFNQLIQKGFIEPVNQNGSHFTGFCRMHPFYRSALVVLAERARFFNFDARGEPTQDFSESFQSCLVGQGVIALPDPDHGKYDLDKVQRMIDDLEKIHLLINVDESAVEFRKKWFPKMKNVNFLHLGRWSALPTDNREVQDTEFLNGFESMRCLKFLSLQGISYLFGLPESISYLSHLEILDLRACYNLESITKKIGMLRSLTHLDMSECYLLDRMPQSLSWLERLKVIKGFVVGHAEKEKGSCTLADLEKLPNLIKLCVYTGLREFPNAEHVRALAKMKSLRKLTITWGGKALQDDEARNSSGEGTKTENNNIPKVKKASKKKKRGQPLQEDESDNCPPILPPTLEKLDLKCFPESKTPEWLKVDNLGELKKLYIRGGKFSDLGQSQDIDNWTGTDKKTWKVEVLRLKYLAEVEMEWKQLRELFPELVYLEQVRCPKLTLFPSDADGVWKNKTRPS